MAIINYMKNKKKIFNLGFNLFLIFIVSKIIMFAFNIKNEQLDIYLALLNRISSIVMIWPAIMLYVSWLNDKNIDDDDDDDIL